jgi:hypothetical protein
MRSNLYLPLILVILGSAWIGFAFGAHSGYIGATFWTCLMHSGPGIFIAGLGVETALRQMDYARLE